MPVHKLFETRLARCCLATKVKHSLDLSCEIMQRRLEAMWNTTHEKKIYISAAQCKQTQLEKTKTLFFNEIIC